MSVVLSIRIPRELKEEMDKLKDKIDWRREIISFIKQRIEEYRRAKILEEINRELARLPPSPKGLAAKLVREDRDSH